MSAVCSRRAACVVCRWVLKNCSGTPRTLMRAQRQAALLLGATRGSSVLRALEDREAAQDHRPVLMRHRRMRVGRVVEVGRVAPMRAGRAPRQHRRFVQVRAARPEAIDLLHPDDVGIVAADDVDRGLQVEIAVGRAAAARVRGAACVHAVVGLAVLDVVGHDPQRAVAGLRFRLSLGRRRDGNHRRHRTGKQVVS